MPNRSFSVYAGYEAIENKFEVPLMGNRYLLKTEERTAPKNQLWLLKEAGIQLPTAFKSPKEIDRPVIVKVAEKGRTIERAFFYASIPEEYEREAEKRIKAGIITREALEESVIEEYVLGAKFNANYFYSPLNDDIDLLGFDRRIQTDLDGVLDLPAREQLELNVATQNIEIGHMGATMRESQLEKVFEAGEKWVAHLPQRVPARNDRPIRTPRRSHQRPPVQSLRRQPTRPRLPLCRTNLTLHEIQVRRRSWPRQTRRYGNQTRSTQTQTR